MSIKIKLNNDEYCEEAKKIIQSNVGLECIDGVVTIDSTFEEEKYIYTAIMDICRDCGCVNRVVNNKE